MSGQGPAPRATRLKEIGVLGSSRDHRRLRTLLVFMVTELGTRRD